MPPDSNWNTPLVRPAAEDFLKHLLIGLISIASRSIFFAVQFVWTRSIARRSTLRVLRPRKSIFSRPTFFDGRAFKLRDQIIGTGLFIDRQEIRQRFIGNHHTARMNGRMTSQPFKLFARYRSPSG